MKLNSPKNMKQTVLIAIALLVPALAFASRQYALDKGTNNTLSTTRETCFPEQNGRIAWGICNLDTAIDIRYMLNDGLAASLTTANGIELSPGECDKFPHGGEQVFYGRIDCIAESGAPIVNTWAY